MLRLVLFGILGISPAPECLARCAHVRRSTGSSMLLCLNDLRERFQIKLASRKAIFSQVKFCLSCPKSVGPDTTQSGVSYCL